MYIAHLQSVMNTGYMPKGHEKDPTKTSLNSPRDLKDTSEVQNVLVILDSNQIRTNPFGSNVTGNTAYKRAERIVAAVYLITNHVHESDPVKVSVRNRGIELLRSILDLKASMRASGSESVHDALSLIRELISMIRLLAVSGHVSAQNAGLLIEALDELGSLFSTAQKSSLAEQFALTRTDLMPMSDTHEAPVVHTASDSPQRKAPKVSRGDGSRPPSEGREVNAARSGQIVDILRAGGILGIKDIAANLPQYSEKMIQRELALLVTQNRVKKMGAKRWSRYQLLTP